MAAGGGFVGMPGASIGRIAPESGRGVGIAGWRGKGCAMGRAEGGAANNDGVTGSGLGVAGGVGATGAAGALLAVGSRTWAGSAGRAASGGGVAGRAGETAAGATGGGARVATCGSSVPFGSTVRGVAGGSGLRPPLANNGAVVGGLSRAAGAGVDGAGVTVVGVDDTVAVVGASAARDGSGT